MFLLPFCFCDKRHDQINMGRLTLPDHSPSLRKVRRETYNRNHGGRLLTGALTGSCVAKFFFFFNIAQEMVLPTVDGVILHQLTIKATSLKLSIGQPG